MKVVLYLSGKASTKRFHNENDSVAGTVTIPKNLQEEFVKTAIEFGALESNALDTVKDNDRLTTIELGAFADAFADWEDELQFGGAPHPLLPLHNRLKRLWESECSCGVYHFIK